MNWHRTQLTERDPISNDTDEVPIKTYTRRQMLAYTAGTLASGTFVVSNTESSGFDVTRHTVSLANLDRPLRIVQITDLHRSQFVSEQFIERVVTAANAAEPDLVLLTGDFVTRTSGYADSCMRPLSRLKARIGKYAVLGNHDYWCDGGNGGPTITDALNQIEIDVLTNRNTKLSNGVRLVGVDDLMGGFPNYGLSFAGTSSLEPTIVMSHNPGTFFILCRYNCLVLAGHTHGGQIYVPGFSKFIIGSKFLRGWYRLPNQPGHMYISRGLGTIHVPMRIGSPPELAVFDVRPA